MGLCGVTIFSKIKLLVFASLLKPMYHYPLELTFKIWALAPQISVTDAQGTLIAYVKQKLFKLKEAITVFADTAQTSPLYNINADRIIDFSARYNFTDSQGQIIGGVKRQGLRSIWKAHYDIFDGETVVMTIREKNPWVKVLDAFFGEIPVIGLLSGYVFNPAYIVSRADGTLVMTLEKQPSFLSRRFIVKQLNQLSQKEQTQALLSLLMMTLLERMRG